MINLEILAQMKKKGKYNLPTMFSYKNGGQISKWIANSGLDLTSLKPYKELSEIEVKLIAEKGEIPQGKKQDMDSIVAFINGEVVDVQTVEPTKQPVKTKVVKDSCGGNCTCDKTESLELAKLKKQVKDLELENKSLKLIAKVFNKEEFEKMKIENA